MSDFTFLKGENIVIKIDGEILGGVTKAVCSVENSYNEIREFLSDIPVEKIAVSNYRIEFATKNGNMFVNIGKFNTLELCDENKTVEYMDCCVESVKTVINAKGSVEYNVVIKAEKRDEHDNGKSA